MTVSIQSPEEILGFRPGSDRCLAGWEQVTSYFDHLSASPRLTWEKIGHSTEGRDLYLATITSAENMARLEELRSVQKRLVEPLHLDDRERSQLMQRARTVMLLTSSIHATEVGSTQMSMDLAYQLVSGEDLAHLLDEVILLMVPCLNPDGLDLVVDWYDQHLDTPFEGTNPPWLYHLYTGHDNNRDWFMLTQAENRAVVENVHNRWHPHIVFDQHQMGPWGARYILPPYIDPIDPAADSVLWAAGGALGLHMAHSLTARGFKGVAVNAIFDAYSPSRAYQHYHGGVRILSEAASARLATPINVAQESLQARRGFDPKARTWNNPEPWEGGRWSFTDIVSYQKAAAVACLEHAAGNRRLWVEGFVNAMQRGEEGPDGLAGYLIPSGQEGPSLPEELMEVLIRGLVKVYRLEKEIMVGGQAFPEGSYWIPLDQAFESFARTLMRREDYPDLRQYSGGPPKIPYDITSHNLPLFMGIETQEVTGQEQGGDDSFRDAWPVSLPLGIDDLRAPASPASGSGLILSPGRNPSYRLVNRVLDQGGCVFQLQDEGSEDHGAFYIPDPGSVEVPRGNWIRTAAERPPGEVRQIRKPTIGLYKSHVPTADEGWTRWILEEYGFDYRSLLDRDVRKGSLEDIDLVLLPDQDPKQIGHGHKAGTYPPDYVGGLGDSGARSLECYLQGGGVVLALGRASMYLVEELLLAGSNVVRDLDSQEFYAPGTMVNLLLNPSHPMTLGMGRRVVGLLTGGPVLDSRGTGVAQFPWHHVRADGFLLGEKHLRGRKAIIEIGLGLGRCILSPIRLQFRAQARGSYPLLFNAFHYAAALRSGEGGNTVA